MLLDLGRNDVGRVAMLREDGRNTPDTSTVEPTLSVQCHSEFHRSSATVTSCT